MINIIGKRKYTYIVSSILVVASVFILFFWGLKLGIDFKGGTLMEVKFSQEETPEGTPENNFSEEKQNEPKEFKSPSREEVQEKVKDLGLTSLNVQESQDNVVILRYIGSDEDLNQKVVEKLNEFEGNVEMLRVDFIGASISKQLKQNAILAIILAIIGIALYIAWSFRKISHPIASWQYGIGAIIALAHDIIITLGIFVLLGKFFNVEIEASFVAALLTILGYSVNDTIVVYDRIRENLIKSDRKEGFESIVNKSIIETIARSINTSLTVVIVLVTIVLFGGESIKYFSLAILIGVLVGTYSSIFVASALMVSNYNIEYKRK
ncbi:MAG: Bifunctional preprotein translocase subunit SecD/SecF [Candidatus Moranbacteria bacterium GW2011_GWF1_34_10]|nr:MAG: Bifunctional preprotein translocase subunit SecD/SecF [Candidatus Moranbacteria bacterium GW2011_GWF1_34_10]